MSFGPSFMIQFHLQFLPFKVCDQLMAETEKSEAPTDSLDRDPENSDKMK